MEAHRAPEPHGEDALAVSVKLRWTFGIIIALMITVVPFTYYRARFNHDRRLREVAPGKLYRSGQLTADGFRDAIRTLGIKTVINLQDEFEDPVLPVNFVGLRKIHEKELCEQLGVNYVWLAPDLISRRKVPGERPEAIDKFLDIMDRPSNYPVLIHCKAGLHRTGCIAAVYRMEYDRYTPAQAVEELKAHGFGDWAATSANDYITQYILSYRPGLRRATASR